MQVVDADSADKAIDQTAGHAQPERHGTNSEQVGHKA
jgi:hypothetical protein